jgi:glutathione peroxidase
MSIYETPIKTLAGEPSSLEPFKGETILIVNVASKCGLTPQYEGLESLQKEYEARGFSVVGFPCNQFGEQEPGSAEEIQTFCSTTYGVTFPMFDKIDVNGDNAHPLYQYLRGEKSGLLGSSIKWNFTKFLIDRLGKVVGRYAPTTTPEALTKDIEALL